MDVKKAKKKPELQEQLFVGNYIDVYHPASKHQKLAYILQKNDKEIEITYDGVGKKDNETLKLQNNRLFLPRRFTSNYTGDDFRGQKTSRDYLKYSKEECEKYTKELNIVIQSNFQGMSPLDICLCIRVRQFIWLDMILSSEVPPKELPIVIEYIKTWFQFIKWYFEQFPKYFADYMKGQLNPELYLVDERVSIAACFCEVVECFCMLFGSIWRLLKPENQLFNLNYDSIQPYLEKAFPDPIFPGFTQNPNIADWKLYQGAHDLIKCIKKTWPFYLRIMTYFKNIGGIQAWENILKQQEGDYNFLPLKIMHKYTLTTQYLSQFYPLPEQINMAKRLVEWIQMRINNLTVQDIKDTDIDSIREVFTEMDYIFLKAFTQEQLMKISDEIQLQLSLKFLKSNFLEKRVKGITEIKDYTEKLKYEISGAIKPKVTITKDELLKWISQHKILDFTLLGDSVHPELIKRSSEVAIFMCKSNYFNIEYIDRIWQANYEKHETTQLALYEFFKALSPYLNFQGIEKLYTHIANIPYSKYNENVVSMVKAFTEAALSPRFHEQLNQIQGDRKYFTFNQLWEMLLDREDQQAGGHIQEQCFQAARQIVSQIPQTKSFIQQYFGKCFELIGSHKSVYQAISFVHYILEKQFKDDPNGKKVLIKQTDQKYNIVELFVKDMEVYMEKIRQYFKGEIPQDIIISGVQTYQQNIFFKLQMLNYLLSQSDLQINYDQIVRLWDTLCAKTKGNIQKKEFNQIIMKQITQDSSYPKINQIYFNKDSELKFFISVLCNPEMNDYYNYTSEDFELFQVFFRSYNSYKQQIKFFGNTSNSRFVVMDLNIEGKKALWSIFAKVNDTQLLEVVSNFIINLYTQLNQSLESKFDKVLQEMMDQCLELISQSNPSLTQRAINLLLQLFNFFQTGPASKKTLKATNFTSFRVTITLQNGQSKIQEYKEGDTTTIHHWKQKVAEELGLAYQQLDITIDNKPIEIQCDVTETCVCQAFLQFSQIRVKVNNKLHPKNYLSQDQKTFDLLKRLLDRKESNEFLSQVWDLINRLPINQAIKLQVETCKEWKQYLDHKFFDMFYVLQIIQRLLSDQAWCSQFTKSDGVDLVTQKFLGQQLNFTQLPLEKKCLLTYLEILSFPQIKIKEPQLIQQIKMKILEILNQFSLDFQNRKPFESGKKTNSQKEQQEIESKLLKICLQQLEDDGIRQFIRDNKLPLQLYSLFVEHDNAEFKKEFQSQLLLLRNSQESKLLLKVIIDDVLRRVVVDNKQKCEHFFEFSCNLILYENQIDQKYVNMEELLSFIRQTLKQLPVTEISAKDQDQILIGLLKLLSVIVEKFQQLANSPGLFIEILGYLLEGEGEIRCKCRSQNSRIAGFNCLFSLLKVQLNLKKFLEDIAPLHSTSTWRTRHLNDWNIQSRFHEKSSTGFVGLYNLGCICYMNSMLQQLFMVPQFRERLLQIEDKDEGPLEENLLHQLKCLFLALKYSQKQYHNPKKFCHSFKDLDGSPTNIFEQMDVDEFCNLLMDRIEAKIKSTSDSELVKRNFGGVMSNEIIGKTCPHYSEREEPFFAVSLPVANKKNLEECLQTLVHGDLLEGDNAYNCEQCNKKVSALKRMCIKKLPDHLILVLKRFNFDFDLMAKAKLNDRIEFPFELDLEPYSQQGLRKVENQDADMSQDHPPEYFQYRLSGAVIHLGSADSGHYYSFIQDRVDLQKWYEFNDINVSPADSKDLKNDGYGGVDKSMKNKLAPQFKDKSKSAYMLFYERIKPINESNQAIEIEPSPRIQSFLDELRDENRKFQIQRFIFSPEYFFFMQNLIKQQILNKDSPDSNQVIKTLIYFYLTCAVRENDKSFITNNIADLVELLKRSPQTCEWLLKCFIQPIYIREFQLDCSKKMVRKYVITLIITAIQTIQQKEGYQILNDIQDDKPKSLVAALINQWILMLSEIKKSLKNSVDYFDIFYKFAKLSKYNAQYLISKKLIGRLLDLFLDAYHQVINNKQIKQIQDLIIKQNDNLKTIIINDDLKNYLGYQNQQNIDAASNYYDELLEKKFEKSMNYGPATSRTYLWRVIAYLLKTEGKQEQSQEEQILLNFDSQLLQIILDEGDCKLSIRSIADILCINSQDNQKQSENIIQSIIKLINDKEYKEYRKYMVVLKKLFMIKDSLTMNRIHSGMSRLLEAMQKQSQYFFETDICQQYILRICFRNQNVYNWMVKNQRLWQWIHDTNSSQQNPNDKLMINNQNPSKCLHRLHNIYLPPSSQAYQKLLQWKKQQFLSLVKEPFKCTDEFDSDDDLTDKIVKVDDKVDYYDNMIWLQGTVTKVMCDYIHVQFAGKHATTGLDLEIDNEKLAPYNTLSNNNKVPGYNQNNNGQEMLIEHQSDHENDTDEGINGSNNQTDSDDE